MFRILLIFAIAVLETLVYTSYIDIFMLSLHTTFHLPSNSSVIIMNPIAKENVPIAGKLFSYILLNDYHSNVY
jgi:hypothetical protein